MPLIYYLCSCKKNQSKFFREAKEAPRVFSCDCGSEYKKQLSAPSNSSKIIIDNGFQAKAVEIDLEVIKSNEENSTKDFSKKD